jgi:hypothetical protein
MPKREIYSKPCAHLSVPVSFNPRFFKSNNLTPRSFSGAPFFMGGMHSFGGKPGSQRFPCRFALDVFCIKQSGFRHRTTPAGQT